MKEVPLADTILPDDPLSVLSRQYAIVCDALKASEARNRALELQVGRLLTSADTLRAALRDLHQSGGGE